MNEELDKLQKSLEKTLSLLKDREVGVGMWWMFLGENLKDITNWYNNRMGYPKV